MHFACQLLTSLTSKMNKIILFLLIIFICSTAHAQDKPWAALLSKDYKVSVNIKNQSVSNVAHWYSTKSGITIVADESLKGNLSFSSAGMISLSDSFDLLESFLNLRGYMLSRENKFLVIKPFYKPPYKYYQPIGPINYEDQEIKVYQLKYQNADNLAKILNEIFKSK